MFNVLPDIFKKEIKTEYFMRRLIVVFAFVVFLQISFLIFIVPSWLSSFYRNREATEEMQSQKFGMVSKNAGDILQTINSTNQNLGVISDNFSQSDVLSLVKKIISYKTPAITLTEFTYDNSAATTTAAMSVSGVAATREDLVAFVKNLEDSDIFSGVTSPLSDLVKDKNISFVISLDAAQNAPQQTP